MSNPVIEIARLPLSQVAGAYLKFCPSPIDGIDKRDAARWLAEQVLAGALTMNDINAAPRGMFKNPVASIDPAVMAGVTSNIESVQAHVAAVDTQVQDIMKTVARQSTLANAQAKAMTILDDRIKGIDDRIAGLKLDDGAIAQTVAKVVADAFIPFKRAVQDAGAEHVIADMASVRAVDRKAAVDVFGVDVRDVRGRWLMVDVWNHPDAPAIDPDFIWTEEILRHLLLSQTTGENLWFGGEKGTGKSETARQFAARTGRAFKRINFHKHTSAEEYIGAIGLKDGETVFQPKDFLSAYATPSTVILLDEVTNADPGELAPLNGFLEPNAAVSFGGMTHRRAPGVLVFAADNTFGNGDDTGRHAGTRAQNVALVDRFARVLAFTFLPFDEEVRAVVNRTGCNMNIAKHVLEAVRVCREKVQSADIVDAPSIRSAMAFIRALEVLDPRQAWESAIVARQPAESASALMSVFESCISPSYIQSNL